MRVVVGGGVVAVVVVAAYIVFLSKPWDTRVAVFVATVVLVHLELYLQGTFNHMKCDAVSCDCSFGAFMW